MGILRELLHDFTFGLVDREGGEESPYRCVKCGTGLDRDYRACPKCGNQFVAAVGADAAEDGDDDEPGQGGGDTAPWNR